MAGNQETDPHYINGIDFIVNDEIYVSAWCYRQLQAKHINIIHIYIYTHATYKFDCKVLSATSTQISKMTVSKVCLLIFI